MAIQILGADGTTTQKIDSTFAASRTTLRPMEVVAWHSITTSTGLLTAAGANTPIWSLRYAPGTGNILIVRRVGVAWGTTTAFTAAQSVAHELFFARSFTVADSGATSATATLTGSNNKHRTSLSTTGITEIRTSTTGSFTAGTRTLDTQPIGVTVGTSNGLGTSLILTNIFQQDTGDYPIVLANQEGLVLQNSIAMGAVGILRVWITVECAEAATY